MLRRVRQVLLPFLGFSLVILAALAVLFWRAEKDYREAAYAEISSLVGSLAESHPEIDAYDFVQGLHSAGQDDIARGTAILQKYGYTAAMPIRASTRDFSTQIFGLALVSLICFCSCLGVYFWYLDCRRSRQIRELVSYLQDLSRRTYNLRLVENSEDELSLLSNELYKLVVALKEAAESNRQAKQSLETSLADISHQLKTPLTSMQVMIDNLHDDPDMPTEIRQDFIRSISRQVDSMSSLVTTLLNLAKFDNGSITMQQLPVKVGELLDGVRQKLAALADLQNVEIKLEGDLSAEVDLDRRWQTEALANIVKNCLEHSPSGSQVMIRAENGPLFLWLTIQDFGEGISPRDLRHIFERFYKAKNSSADSVGIGLSFARTVIEANNGQISVRSTEGKGTTFTIKYFK